MEIQVSKVDTKREEKVLLAMIVNTAFMQQVRNHIDINLFTTKASRKIGQWTTDYFDQYDKCCGMQLNTIFENRELELDEATKEYVSGLMEKISSLGAGIDSSEYNIEYQVDQAFEFFKSRRLEKLIARVQSDLLVGKLDSAENQVVEYMSVGKEESTGMDLFRDIEKIRIMGLDEKNVLLQPPGAFGELTGPFRRGDFVMYQSKAKAGKSWLLQQHGIWGSLGCHLNVLHIALEMVAPQVKDRYYTEFTCLPAYSSGAQREILVPNFSEDNTIEYMPFKQEGIISPDIIEETAFDLRMQSKGGRVVIEAFPTGSFSVRSLRMLLDKYETLHDIVFDVIIIDYADLMSASDPKAKDNDKLDDIYRSLRGLAQEKSNLIITVTQGNREGFTKDNKASTIAGDYRKLTHVTHAVVMNQTPEEKMKGYYRLSAMAGRNQHFDENEEVIVLYNLDIGRMYCDSRWKKDVIFN